MSHPKKMFSTGNVSNNSNIYKSFSKLGEIKILKEITFIQQKKIIKLFKPDNKNNIMLQEIPIFISFHKKY